jgi:uncharacterized protein (DUF1501 family)
MAIDRRGLLRVGAVTGAALAAAPRVAVAGAGAQTERRFVFVLLRGAADGVYLLAPVGDPHFPKTRAAFLQDAEAGTRLDADFSLHPALPGLARLHAAGEALFAHSIASAYRDRSHFDGQNLLETGGSVPHRLKDGWMNRLLGLLPRDDARAVALAATVPLALRGAHEVSTFAPSGLPGAAEDLLERIGRLYEADPQLGGPWARAMATRATLTEPLADAGRGAAAAGALAARLLSGSAGARIAMIETGGWDSHAQQRGRLTAPLRALDTMLGALQAGLGAEWARTVVLVATEFGRTVTVNGTGGTDHGGASVAMLAGGAVRGGRVIADWPGLAPSALLEGRDLRPTLSLERLVAGVVSEHFALDPARVLATLYPDGVTGRPVEGLVREPV